MIVLTFLHKFSLLFCVQIEDFSQFFDCISIFFWELQLNYQQSTLFENHEFALDPTDPRYKDVESKALIASEREKRRAKKLAKLEKIREEMLKNGDNVTLDEDDDFPGSASKKKGPSGGIGKNELDSMIQSLKRKQALAMQKRK